jgi:hypothetical protein
MNTAGAHARSTVGWSLCCSDWCRNSSSGGAVKARLKVQHLLEWLCCCHLFVVVVVAAEVLLQLHGCGVLLVAHLTQQQQQQQQQQQLLGANSVWKYSQASLLRLGLKSSLLGRQGACSTLNPTGTNHVRSLQHAPTSSAQLLYVLLCGSGVQQHGPQQCNEIWFSSRMI